MEYNDFNFYNGNNETERSEQDSQTDFTEYKLNDQGLGHNSPNGKRKKKARRYSLSAIVLSIILSAVIGASTATAAVLFAKEDNDNNMPINYQGGTTVTNISVDETAQNIIEAVAKKVTPSVVGIATTASTNSFFGGNSESSGEGSGIIYSSDGYIITNYHVIQSAATNPSSKIEVYLASNTDKPLKASIVGYNISNDLAVIKIAATNLPAIELGDVEKLKVGQFVAAIGSPGGLEFMGSVTYGIISGLNRVISDNSSDDEVNLIQTDAAINPGNSGGALVDINGKLIGVNSSKIAATEYEGMGFAIPIDTVKEICDKIIAKENDPNPYIGITISERYDAATLTEYGYPTGAVVKSVISGGPAYEAGIRSGDIITEFNGVEIKEYTQLSDEIAKTKPNQVVNVKIYRRKYRTTKITIGSNNSQ